MTALALLVAILQTSGDTVAFTVEAAFARGLERSSTLSAAVHATAAAEGLARQATALPNPRLGLSAENVGQQRSFTGIPGREGLEGQAVFTVPLPLGWERAGTVGAARAGYAVASATARRTELDVQEALLAAMGSLLRDSRMLETAEQEFNTLDRIAEALAQQSQAGRASLGDAARANLARGMAGTALARREAGFARSSSDLARLLELPPGTFVQLDPPRCRPQPMNGAPVDAPAPELLIAQARVDAARSAVRTARGLQLPDLEPQVGIRRSGGNTGLFLGISTQLPFFDLGTQRIAAARATEVAALALQRNEQSQFSAARTAASAILTALERAGARFDAGWFEATEQTVTAAEARYDLGEGTLFELLDSRRARTQALDDYHTWLTEWWGARAAMARFEGRPLTPSLLCTDPYRENL